MRAIDADAFKEYITDACEDMKHLFNDGGAVAKLITESFCKDIDEQPTIQPETAKRIIGKSRGGMTLWYQCNVCNEPVDEKDAYCRGCGRRLIDG